MITRATKLAISAIASVVLLAGVIWYVGFDETLNAVLETGLLAFLLIGFVVALLAVLQALAWSILARAAGCRMPMSVLIKATVVGQAGNILTPSTYLGGEPVKVIYAGRKTGLGYQKIAGTVLLGKCLEALSFLLFLGIVAIAAAIAFRDVLFQPANLALGITEVVVATVALSLSIVLWVSLWRTWAPLTGLVRLLSKTKLFPHFFRNLRIRTLRVERQVSQVFREEGSAVVPAFCMYMLGHIVIFLKPLAFFYLGWRIGLNVAELSLIFMTCQVLLAVQLTPSGVGTLDAGMFGILAVAGIAISQPRCAAFLLCLRFWDAVHVAVGAILAARAGAGFFSPRGPLVDDDTSHLSEMKETTPIREP